MKKLLMITRNFPPLVGGMEKLNQNIHKILCKYYDVTLIGPVGCRAHVNDSHVYEFPALPLWRYFIISVLKAIWVARKTKSDLVFCGSGAAIIAGYIAARVTSARLVCYLHGLDVVAKSKLYQYIFIPLIKKCDLILVNSHHTLNLAVMAGFDSALIHILHPGVDLPDLVDSDRVRERFRKKYDLGNSPLLLIAGRLTERKGIAEFISEVMGGLVAEFPDLKLIIIGDEASSAIKKSKGVLQKINSTIVYGNFQSHIILLGSLDDEMLSAAYFSSDGFVFPVLNISGDVEGFGMVAVEAAAHGLPTFAFAVGGVPDAVSHGKSGWILLSDDYGGMRNCISKYLKEGAETMKGSCRLFALSFSWSIFEEKLIELIGDEL
jgi:phosphatidyl-myo-inositol dimannoside synthase